MGVEPSRSRLKIAERTAGVRKAGGNACPEKKGSHIRGLGTARMKDISSSSERSWLTIRSISSGEKRSPDLANLSQIR